MGKAQDENKLLTFGLGCKSPPIPMITTSSSSRRVRSSACPTSYTSSTSHDLPLSEFDAGIGMPTTTTSTRAPCFPNSVVYTRLTTGGKVVDGVGRAKTEGLACANVVTRCLAREGFPGTSCSGEENEFAVKTWTWEVDDLTRTHRDSVQLPGQQRTSHACTDSTAVKKTIDFGLTTSKISSLM